MTETRPVIGLAAPGSMGAPLGGVLVAHGLEVRCNLENRSAQSKRRALEAGLRPASDDEVARADIILSIVAPENALPVARHVAGIVRAAGSAPVFADCNAIAPTAVADIARLMAENAIVFADCGIIGPPPSAQRKGPRLYASGAGSGRIAALQAYGLDVKVIDGPAGAASALKLSYAGITKGLIAAGATMFLAAERAGVGDLLKEEMAQSQAQVLAGFARSIPDMLGKAGRWVGEMHEIAAFIGEGRDERVLYDGAAALYARLAKAGASDVDVLKRFFPARDHTEDDADGGIFGLGSGICGRRAIPGQRHAVRRAGSRHAQAALCYVLLKKGTEIVMIDTGYR